MTVKNMRLAFKMLAIMANATKQIVYCAESEFDKTAQFKGHLDALVEQVNEIKNQM